MVDDSAVAEDLSHFSAEVGDHCVTVAALKIAVDAQCVEALWTEGGMEGGRERGREGVQVDLGMDTYIIIPPLFVVLYMYK